MNDKPRLIGNGNTMRKTAGILLKIVMLAVALLMLPALLDAEKKMDVPLSPEMLPDYNYIQIVKQLLHQNRFREASELCADIIAQELPGAEEAKALKKLCDQEISYAANRLRRGARGFITGSTNSVEEAGGAIISDIIIYGDIRDLAMQGWFKITGQETDPLIICLASVGLCTELIQWADWMPAVLKAMRKAGALTERFAGNLQKLASKAVKTGKMDQASAQLFSNLSTLLRRNSFQRSACLLQYVETPKDLALYLKVAEHSPSAPYLLIKSGGADGAFVLRKFGGTPSGIHFLAQAARKGPAGVAFLKNHMPYKTLKWGAHFSKMIYMGHFYDFVAHTAATFPAALWGFWLLVVMMSLYGLTVFYDFYRILRKIHLHLARVSRRKRAAASTSGTSGPAGENRA